MLANKIKSPANLESEVPHFYLWLNNEACQGINAPLEIRSPFDATLVGTVSVAGRRQIREAISSSKKAFQKLSMMPRYQRSILLKVAVELLYDARTELIDASMLEGGKKRMLAEQEFDQAVEVFKWAARESERLCSKQLAINESSDTNNPDARIGFVPTGTIFAITPFNFPLNMLARKVAPALMSANPVILKPASDTPITSLILAHIISEAGFPAGSLNAMPMKNQDMHLLFQSDEVKMISFTGSSKSGWSLNQGCFEKAWPHIYS